MANAYGPVQQRMGEHMRKLFEILIPHPEGLPRDVAVARLLDSITLSEHEAGIYASTGGKRIDALISFATANFVRAGWLVKRHGLWRVTPAGLQALREFTDGGVFIRTATRIKNARQARLGGGTEAPVPAPSALGDPLPMLAAAMGEGPAPDALTCTAARDRAQEQIRAHIGRMSAYEFQRLVADLLRGLGWYVPWIAGPGKDGGVDIVGFRDPLGATARRLKVQVTQGAGLVDIARLRSFVGVLHDDDIGLFVAACGFTRDAEEFARVQARRRVTLLDLEGLVELWGQNYAKLDDAARRRLPLQPVWWLAGEGVSPNTDRAEIPPG